MHTYCYRNSIKKLYTIILHKIMHHLRIMKLFI
jgi:hypothetical protein